ncbi:MAG: hypothetical protein EOP84_05625 [Verrucomicrobiaceae bacterium]|nr:MAG: hypothetical protein EOP84_05625 [Verrucomicrobiaceae bacterium]
MSHSASAEVTLEEAKTNGMWETLQSYIEHSPAIVDICIFEQEWVPPSKSVSKGQLMKRAVVTYVHHGAIPVGTKIEYVHYIEDSPRFLGKFTSVVRGDLRTFFFDPHDAKVVDGGMRLEGDGHWGFDRVGNAFAGLFHLELKSNPKLTTKSNQTVQ